MEYKNMVRRGALKTAKHVARVEFYTPVKQHVFDIDMCYDKRSIEKPHAACNEVADNLNCNLKLCVSD